MLHDEQAWQELVLPNRLQTKIKCQVRSYKETRNIDPFLVNGSINKYHLSMKAPAGAA